MKMSIRKRNGMGRTKNKKNKNTMKKWTGLACAGLACLALAACGSGGGKEPKDISEVTLHNF